MSKFKVNALNLNNININNLLKKTQTEIEIEIRHSSPRGNIMDLMPVEFESDCINSWVCSF